MAKHIEREQMNQVTELTADEMERVSGGVKYELVDVKISSVQINSHEPRPTN
jgi:hypothetical protein